MSAYYAWLAGTALAGSTMWFDYAISEADSLKRHYRTALWWSSR